MKISQSSGKVEWKATWFVLVSRKSFFIPATSFGSEVIVLYSRVSLTFGFSVRYILVNCHFICWSSEHFNCGPLWLSWFLGLVPERKDICTKPFPSPCEAPKFHNFPQTQGSVPCWIASPFARSDNSPPLSTPLSASIIIILSYRFTKRISRAVA